MKKMLMFSIGSLCFFMACKTDSGEALYPNTPTCDTANITYSGFVKPLVQTNCLNQGCHTSGNPSGGFTFESYSGLAAVVSGDKLINSLKYVSGSSKNMPPTGKLSDCDINKVDAWIKRGAPNN